MSTAEQSHSDFLVRTHVALPDSMPASERKALLDAEHKYACELVLDAGVLRGIWRIPGAVANLAIWRVANATELHSLLSRRPLAQWMVTEVTALAEHPVAVKTGLNG